MACRVRSAARELKLFAAGAGAVQASACSPSLQSGLSAPAHRPVQGARWGPRLICHQSLVLVEWKSTAETYDEHISAAEVWHICSGSCIASVAVTFCANAGLGSDFQSYSAKLEKAEKAAQQARAALCLCLIPVELRPKAVRPPSKDTACLIFMCAASLVAAFQALAACRPQQGAATVPGWCTGAAPAGAAERGNQPCKVCIHESAFGQPACNCKCSVPEGAAASWLPSPAWQGRRCVLYPPACIVSHCIAAACSPAKSWLETNVKRHAGYVHLCTASCWI